MPAGLPRGPTDARSSCGPRRLDERNRLLAMSAIRKLLKPWFVLCVVGVPAGAGFAGVDCAAAAPGALAAVCASGKVSASEGAAGGMQVADRSVRGPVETAGAADEADGRVDCADRAAIAEVDGRRPVQWQELVVSIIAASMVGLAVAAWILQPSRARQTSPDWDRVAAALIEERTAGPGRSAEGSRRARLLHRIEPVAWLVVVTAMVACAIVVAVQGVAREWATRSPAAIRSGNDCPKT